jgi:hypothetical protein
MNANKKSGRPPPRGAKPPVLFPFIPVHFRPILPSSWTTDAAAVLRRAIERVISELLGHGAGD